MATLTRVVSGQDQRAYNGKLLLATRNPGKMRELQSLLSGCPFEVTSLAEEEVDLDVEETGASFEENAVIKARAYGTATGLLTLADDSGLEVDALGGAPGVTSARYGGPGLSDEQRVSLLLENLKDVEWEHRSGRFRCVIALALPTGETKTVEGAVEGVIQRQPRGQNGFGYDPVFYVPQLGRTTAELSMEEKNRISHRAQAARKAALLLRQMSQNGLTLGQGWAVPQERSSCALTKHKEVAQ
jgi:XTP/dITP diphosphohydrolase